MSRPLVIRLFRNCSYKQAIHEVTLRYCRGADRLDAELVTSASSL